MCETGINELLGKAFHDNNEVVLENMGVQLELRIQNVRLKSETASTALLKASTSHADNEIEAAKVRGRAYAAQYKEMTSAGMNDESMRSLAILIAAPSGMPFWVGGEREKKYL
jgi:hypothetical protein